jgi:hypothetical protein
MRSRYLSALLAGAVLVGITTATAVAAPGARTGAAAGAVAAVGAGRLARGAAAAPAVAQAAHPGSCTGSGSSRSCEIPVQDVHSAFEFNPIIFRRSDGTAILTQPGTDVDITCWYYGNPPNSNYAGDGILDHTQSPVVGHIPDPYVNEGGENPWQSPYNLPECS